MTKKETIDMLIVDLNKASKIIRQYHKFHNDLKDKLYIHMDLNSKMPETIPTINVDKNEYDRLKSVANIIRKFKIDY